ncbi:hypothetical protein A6770_28465 [Nostoc minutum NIES-26]|uniref:DNA-directed DNA polymerase n=1 Tax=Nostoc minutum NIES-26 TaxID=1844469 RepID=A0A367QM34_9NOSO|nr:hypothetical protein A6770_28465 [Nostoc minutum NIES-26]
MLTNSKQLTIATDSEWHSPDKSWLVTTFTVIGVNKPNRFLYVDESVSNECKQQLIKWGFEENVSIEFVLMDDHLNLLDKVVKQVDPTGLFKTIRLLLFYSPKDVEYSIGWSKFSELLLGGFIQQKRNISTPQPVKLNLNNHEYKVSIKDMKGWVNGSLNQLAESVGVSLDAKNVMDEYKSHMREGLEALPTLFAAYSIGDVDHLSNIYDAFVELTRWVQSNVIGINEADCFNGDNIPMTTGSLVAATLDKWIHSQHANKNLLKFAMRKLGLLDTSAPEYKFSLAAFINTTKQYRDVEALTNDLTAMEVDTKAEQYKLLNQFMKAKFKHFGHSQAGVQYFAKVTDDSAAFNALVQGGRCNNERPSEYVCHVGADIDLASCYGSALREFIYPLGLPTVWGFKPNQPRLTLRQWLKRNENELVDNLWTVTVSGDLSFTQDLIYSKLVTQTQINRAGVGDWDKNTTDPDRDDDLSHIPGDFALIRKQILNGIITSDVLRVLRAVATDNEIKQLLDTEVVSGVAYLATNRVDSVDQWVNTVVADKGQLYNRDGKHGHSRDTRTRCWVGLPLEDFIGKLVNERNRLKKLKKSESATEDERTLADAKQAALKLFINTAYGIIASPYFSVGNTVVANNITARARVGAWMLNKALHTRQSITDGGMYSLMTVPVLRDNAKLPGLAVLSDNTQWKDARFTRVLEPLACVDWESEFNNDGNVLKQLDQLTTQHINNFWKRYGLSLPFAIEHKLENTFTVAAYINKAHYLLVTRQGKWVYKIRGAREYNDSDLRKHPTFALLKAIVEDSDKLPNDLSYDHRSLMKGGKWLEVQHSNGYPDLKDHRPGDEITEERTARYNNTHIFCMTVAEYEKRNGRKTFERGEPVEFFERYREDGWSKVHAQMMLDSLAAGKTKGNKHAAKRIA